MKLNLENDGAKNKIFNKNIYLLIIIEFFSSFFLIKVIYTLFFQMKGISLTQLGIIFACYQISKFIFEIPTGVVADKYGRKLSVFIGFCLYIVYLVLVYHSTTFIALCIATTVQGVAYTFVSGAISALLVDSMIAVNKKEKIGFINSINRAIFIIALAISALLGGIISNRFSYNTTFIMQIIIFIIPALLILFVKEPPIYENDADLSLESVSAKSVWQFICNKPRLLYFNFIHMFIGLSFIAIDGYYSNYLIATVQLSEKLTGFILFILQISVGIMSIFFMKKIKEKYKMKCIFIFPIIMMTSLMTSFMIQEHILSYFIYWIALSSFYFTNPLIFDLSNREIPSKYRATAGSFTSMFLAVSAIISNTLFGYLSETYGMRNAFLTLIIISFVFLIGNNLKFFNQIKSPMNPTYSIEK